MYIIIMLRSANIYKYHRHRSEVRSYVYDKYIEKVYYSNLRSVDKSTDINVGRICPLIVKFS